MDRQLTPMEMTYHTSSNPTAHEVHLARLVRSDWGVENHLHCILDVAFPEEGSRHHTTKLAANLTNRSHMATNLLRVEKTCMTGIANKRLKAGRSQDYLLRGPVRHARDRRVEPRLPCPKQP